MINKIVSVSVMVATWLTMTLLIRTGISYNNLSYNKLPLYENKSGLVAAFKSPLDADNFAQKLQQQRRSYTKVYMGQLYSIRWNDATHNEYQDLMTRRQELGIRCMDAYGWCKATYAPTICFNSQESLNSFVAQLDKEIESSSVHGPLYTQEGTTVHINYPELAEAKYRELQGKEKEYGIVSMHLYS